MKKIISLFVVSAILFAGCEKPNVIPEPDEPVQELEVTVNLDKSEVTVSKGETVQLVATVSPGTMAVEWTSADPKVAIVDRNGKVLGLSVGETVVSAQAGDKVATCDVSVVLKPKVGDFYYSDGSYSSTYDSGKSAIGVVFWVGDPTEHDDLLKRDHPDCTNGLVVAIHDRSADSADDGECYHWQADYEMYGRGVGEWLAANRPEYQSITSPFGKNEVVNAQRGYNNTKAIEAFNAAPENKSWMVGVVERVRTFREELPAPASSSDWYLPSVKECSLLISGETSGDVLNVNDDTDNISLINYKLSIIPGATSVGRQGIDDDIWSSNERDSEYAFYVSTFSGKVWMNWKKYGSEHHRLRCVLAF